MTNIEVGARLAMARKNRGLSLRDVEAMSGGEILHTSLCRYESGNRSLSLTRATRLAHLYDVAPATLLFGEVN